MLVKSTDSYKPAVPWGKREGEGEGEGSGSMGGGEGGIHVMSNTLIDCMRTHQKNGAMAGQSL